MRYKEVPIVSSASECVELQNKLRKCARNFGELRRSLSLNSIGFKVLDRQDKTSLLSAETLNYLHTLFTQTPPLGTRVKGLSPTECFVPLQKLRERLGPKNMFKPPVIYY